MKESRYMREFKEHLKTINSGFLTEPMNTTHSKMYVSFLAGVDLRLSSRESLLDEHVPELFAGTNEALDNLLDKVGG